MNCDSNNNQRDKENSKNEKCYCGGNLVIIFFYNEESKMNEPDYGICDQCLRKFTVS